MHLYGKIVVIKRNGTDGAHFPLTDRSCVFGRGAECDIRIQLPTVDSAQCQIEIDDKGQASIKGLSATSSTLVNNTVLPVSLTALSHNDVISIADRMFRFEYAENSQLYPHKSSKTKSPKTPRGLNTPTTSDSAVGEKSPKTPRRSFPVVPLSPRTDNVPQSSGSIQSGTKKTPSPPASEMSKNTNRKPTRRSSGSPKKNTAPDFLFSLSPSSFYKTSVTPRARKKVSDVQPTEMSATLGTPSTSLPDGPGLQSSSKSVRQRSPGSPYSKVTPNLRKSITDLKRRSLPVFEIEEDSTQVAEANERPDNKVEKASATIQAGSKRKSCGIWLPSAKRKRVSFGPNLSPEHFDRTLPPKTPVKRGATPSATAKEARRKSLLKKRSPKNNSPVKNVSSPKTPVRALSSRQITVVSETAETPPSTQDSAAAESLQSSQTTPKTSPGKKSPLLKSNKKSPQERASPKHFSGSGLSQDNMDASVQGTEAEYNTTPKNLPSPADQGVSSLSCRKVGRPRGSSSFLQKSTPHARFQQTSSSLKRSSLSAQKIPRSTFNFSASLNTPVQSQDLFSQATPKSAAGGVILKNEQTSKARMLGSTSKAKNTSPTGLKRIFKTPRQKYTDLTEITPTALRRVMKTPKNSIVSAAVSPTGVKLVKTPRFKRTTPVLSSPSGLKRLLKTPKGKEVSRVSLTGIKEMMKTPRREYSHDVSFSGIASLFKTPVISEQNDPSVNANNSNVTYDIAGPFSGKRIRSPKKFFDDAQPTSFLASRKSISSAHDILKSRKTVSPSGRKRSLEITSSVKKTVANLNISAEKILPPPQDINKVVALRAIHRHGSTPKLAILKKTATPKSVMKISAKPDEKPQHPKTWSDIVRSGIQKVGPAKKIAVPFSRAAAKIKSPPAVKRPQKTPKTPRTLIAALAPTTGHADSPVTIIVGKKTTGKAKTPRPLPRKGRKESLSKASRKSAGNVSFTGLAELFTQDDDLVQNESALYADIPDTPDGPNKMFVSPLSSGKESTHTRKSANLVGVRELFMMKKQQEPELTGVKELFVPPKTMSDVSPAGMKQLMKTPKKITHSANSTEVSPAGMKRLLKTPKNLAKNGSPREISPYGIRKLLKTPKRLTGESSPTGVQRLLATPKNKVLLVSPAGLETLFKTPETMSAVSTQKRKSSLEQNTPETLLAPEPAVSSKKSGTRGRKRSAVEPANVAAVKKIACSPAQEVTEAFINPTPGKSKVGRPRKADNVSPLKLSLQKADVSSKRISPIKSPVQSKKDTVRIIEPPSEEMVTFVKSAPLSAKITRGQVKIIESTPIEEITVPAAQVGKALLPNKSSRGRREVQMQEMVQILDDTGSLSVGRSTSKGRKGNTRKAAVVIASTAEEPSSLLTERQISDPENYPVNQSPAKAVKTRRGQSVKELPEVTMPSVRSSRKARGQISVAAIESALTPPSRNRKAASVEVNQHGIAPALRSNETVIVDTLPKPVRRKGRPPLVVAEPSPKKLQGTKRRGAVLRSPVVENQILSSESAPEVAPQETKNTGVKRKAEEADSDVDTKKVKIVSPVKPRVARRGGKTDAGLIDKTKKISPVKASPVRPRATRRGQATPLKSSSPANVPMEHRRGRPKKVIPTAAEDPVPLQMQDQRKTGRTRANITDASSVVTPLETATVRKTSITKGQQGHLKKEAVNTPKIETSAKGRRGQVKEAAVNKSEIETSPAKSRRGQFKKAAVNTSEIETSPTKSRRGQFKKAAVNKSEVETSPAKGRRGQFKKAAVNTSEIETSPTKSRRGQFKKAAVNTSEIETSPSKSRRGQLKKAIVDTSEIETSPTKGRRGQFKKAAVNKSEIETSPAKGRRGQLKKAAVNKSEIETSPTKGRRGQLKKAAVNTSEVETSPTKSRRGQLKNAAVDKSEIDVSPAKGRRGQLKKAATKAVEIKVSPAKRGRPKTFKSASQSTPVSKKAIRKAENVKNKSDAVQQKSTATRRTRHQ